MEDADEGANEVIGLGLGTESAGLDGALDQGEEGVVGEAAGAFDEAHGAAGDAIHGGEDEFLLGDMVNEEEHPGAERGEWRQGGGEALAGGGKFFDVVAVDGFDEGVAGGEVTVERAGADAGLAGDVVEGRFGSLPGEGAPGHLKDALAVALCIGAGLAGERRGWGRRGRHFASGENVMQPGTVPGYLYLHMWRLSPFYAAGMRMSTLSRPVGRGNEVREECRCECL